VEQNGLEGTRLAAIHEYERYAEEIWKEYGVNPTTLDVPLTTTVWKTMLIGQRRKQHYVQVEKDLEAVPNSIVEKHLGNLLLANDVQELRDSLAKAKQAILELALYLWAKGRAEGPNGAEDLLKKAQKAKYLANYLERHGKADYAATQRERAYLLQQKAAGADVILTKRGEGVTHKAREIYAKLEKDGPKERSVLIAAARAAGIHPGTCAVQYAHYRREQRTQEK
jgi:hypothetical protein